ncbi:DUF2971 domain-containing protein [Rhizobium sp. 814_E9_N1_1]|uniref:DUF2971 domain-containing protein n=1 Tax=unclassified Rhizobium TaxID=2613769 RepID=UPI003F26103E
MRLYHFTSQKFGLLAIRNQRLKVARINALNDPFEFLGWNLQDPQTRAKLRKWKEERNAELGILCFSRKWSNPLLWGHYADKHQGLALGFDVPDGDLYSPVKYRHTRLPTPVGRELIGEHLDSLLLTKFSAWRYESEYRCFCRLGENIHDNGLYFEPFSPTLKLVEVIIGDQATITRAELAVALGDRVPQIASFKARPAFGTFSVVRNRDAKLWK